MHSLAKEIFIQEKAFKLLIGSPVKSVTMDDIAHFAGVSKKTLYQIFHCKEEVVIKVITDAVESIKTKIENNITVAKNPLHEVELQLSVLPDVIEMRLLFNSVNLKSQPDALTIVEGFKRSYLTAIVEEHIGKGIQQGVYRPDLVTGNTAPIIILLFEMYLFNRPEAPVEIYKVVDFYLNAIMSEKGRQFYATMLKHKLNF